jgi:hypothetical protein
MPLVCADARPTRRRLPVCRPWLCGRAPAGAPTALWAPGLLLPRPPAPGLWPPGDRARRPGGMIRSGTGASGSLHALGFPARPDSADDALLRAPRETVLKPAPRDAVARRVRPHGRCSTPSPLTTHPACGVTNPRRVPTIGGQSPGLTFSRLRMLVLALRPFVRRQRQLRAAAPSRLERRHRRRLGSPERSR